jgi:hypothetical protein
LKLLVLPFDRTGQAETRPGQIQLPFCLVIGRC